MIRLSLAATTVIAVLAGTATPAFAAQDHEVMIRGTAVCDHKTGQFAVTWTVTNPNDLDGTIEKVQSEPVNRPIKLPTRLEAGETVLGAQTLKGSEYTGRISFDVNWADGENHSYNWPIYIKFACSAS